jgi:DNA-binding CsgD family transcriptional regulator
MIELEHLQNEYAEILNLQQFVEDDLDYSIVEKHKPFLEKLSQVSNSGITVFDLYKKEHIFTSYNFTDIFGYDLDSVNEYGNEYFNSRVHPEDLAGLIKNGIKVMKLCLNLPLEERANYKFVNEYRILGKDLTYLRVIEQHQALELDKHGNLWLALGVIDISPDQSEFEGINFQVINYKTGKTLPFIAAHENGANLTKREKEVLQLVKKGYLSKEISEKLFISVHTVNTHRQRILEKLGANNSVEASAYASKLGL